MLLDTDLCLGNYYPYKTEEISSSEMVIGEGNSLETGHLLVKRIWSK